MPAYYDEERKSWYASFYYKDWQGATHQKKKRGFKLKKDALAFERDFKAKQASSCDMKLSDFTEIYLDDMRNRVKESTVDQKRFIIERHILPVFGEMAINKITSAHIRKWQSELMDSDNEYAQTTLHQMNVQFGAIFNYAQRFYGLEANPVKIAGKIGKQKADEMEIWTIDEFEQFIAVVNKPEYHLAFMLLFWTGIRSGECIALTKADFRPNHELIIKKNVDRRKGTTGTTKTESSERIISVPDFVYDEAMDYMNRLYGLKPNDKIFHFAAGSLNTTLTQLAEKAGVKRIRVHDLRHSHAAHLIELKYDIYLISRRLGHENIKTTTDTYGHLYPNKQIQLAEELSEYAKNRAKTVPQAKKETP